MSDLDKAVSILKQGGIIIFPTDTAFGIGCRMDNEDSVKKLFKIRNRPQEKAMPVLFDTISRVKEYIKPVDQQVESLMEKYWPGALTIVTECIEEKVISQVRGGGSTLGVRIPDYERARELIRGVGAPITGSSANFAGRETPFSLEGLDKTLIKLVDFVLEGKTNGQNRSSTVLDCSVEPWKIIRQGDVAPDL